MSVISFKQENLAKNYGGLSGLKVKTPAKYRNL